MAKKSPAQNLAAAARYLAGLETQHHPSPHGVNPELAAAYRAAGASEADLAQLQAEQQAHAAQAAFEVLPENWDVLRLLAACTGCWRYGPDGKPNGFHYADAAQLADWQAVAATTQAQLPIAINAILRG